MERTWIRIKSGFQWIVALAGITNKLATPKPIELFSKGSKLALKSLVDISSLAVNGIDINLNKSVSVGQSNNTKSTLNGNINIRALDGLEVDSADFGSDIGSLGVNLSGAF